MLTSIRRDKLSYVLTSFPMAVASYIADISVLYIYMFVIIELSALSYNTMCGCVHRYAYIDHHVIPPFRV